MENIAGAWCGQISNSFTALLNESFGGLQKIGTASNGESFYQRIGA